MTKDELNIDEKQDLDLSHGQHLVPEVVLVLSNGAVPAADGLVLADHDVLGDLVEESTTVVS